MPKNIFSFTDIPPRIAYVDPSFFINFLVEDALYHKECLAYSNLLKKSSIITPDADFSVVKDIDIYTCNPKCFS